MRLLAKRPTALSEGYTLFVRTINTGYAKTARRRRLSRPHVVPSAASHCCLAELRHAQALTLGFITLDVLICAE